MKSKHTFFILFIILAGGLVISACGTAAATEEPQPTTAPTTVPTAEPTAVILPEPTAAPTAAPALEFVRSIAGDPNPLSKPIAVTLDDQDNLYVLEAGSGRVQVFDPNGQFLRMWGSPGAGDGQFNLNHPNGLALAADGYPGLEHYGDIAVDSSGNVYVLDTFNYRVQKFANDGTFLAKWGEEAVLGKAADGEFIFPAGMATDLEGNVYVSDGGRPDVQKFDPQGNLLAKIGGSSNGDGAVSLWGSSIAVGPDGLIYVSDYGNAQIQVFDPDGQLLREWPVVEVWRIAVDGEGNIYAALSTKDSLVKFDPQGEILFKWGERGGGDNQFRRPKGLAIDSKGLIYVADYDNNRVQILRPSASTIASGSADPATIAQNYLKAIEDGDLEAAMALVADDVKCRGDLYITGKQSFQYLVQADINDGGRAEISNLKVEGDKVTYNWEAYSEAGFFQARGRETLQIKDGLIVYCESEAQ
jgi:DNA-binding beta-propeller fold protein YncE